MVADPKPPGEIQAAAGVPHDAIEAADNVRPAGGIPAAEQDAVEVADNVSAGGAGAVDGTEEIAPLKSELILPTPPFGPETPYGVTPTTRSACCVAPGDTRV